MCVTGTGILIEIDYAEIDTATPEFEDPWSLDIREMGAWERTVEVIESNRMTGISVGDYSKKCFATLVDHGPIDMSYDWGTMRHGTTPNGPDGSAGTGKFADIRQMPNLPLMAAGWPGELTITWQLSAPGQTPATLVGHGGIVTDNTPELDADGNTEGLGNLQWQFDGWTDAAKTANGPVWTPETTIP